MLQCAAGVPAADLVSQLIAGLAPVIERGFQGATLDLDSHCHDSKILPV